MTLDANVLPTTPRLPDPVVNGVLKPRVKPQAALEKRNQGVSEIIQAQSKHMEGDRRPSSW
ncbi:hypothetical protein F4805DRAFT_362464 [Annulohypoxylon moriforme]|nr:hypothetical protein F4805DRAFT_362464 [Annulohypoxylon moriforme]